MNEFTLGGIIVLFTAVLPCLVLGYLIAFHGRRGLISGWSDSKVSDPESGGKIIGLSLMVMAILLAGVTTLWIIQFFTETELIYYLLPSTLIPVAASVFVKIKYGIK